MSDNERREEAPIPGIACSDKAGTLPLLIVRSIGMGILENETKSFHVVGDEGG